MRNCYISIDFAFFCPGIVPGRTVMCECYERYLLVATSSMPTSALALAMTTWPSTIAISAERHTMSPVSSVSSRAMLFLCVKSERLHALLTIALTRPHTSR